MKLAVYASTFRSPETATLASRFISEALARGNSLALATATIEALEQARVPVPKPGYFEMKEAVPSSVEADFIVSLGGDGTFLRAARWSGDSGTPVAGVNLGHLGYLPAFSPAELPSLIDRLKARDFRIEERSLLRIQLPHETEEAARVWPYALNELAILKQDTSSMITVPVNIDGEPMATYRADGLIVSTPTGSTGYNLSVGGPILQPTVPAWVISPIADHSLTMRPMVIADNSVLDLTARGRAGEFMVSLDGNSFSLPVDTHLRVSRAPFACKVVMKKESPFAMSLRSKLLWGQSTVSHDDAGDI